MSDDTITAIGDAVDNFKRQFETSDGHLLGDDSAADAAK
jgi:F-type H+-transporting ATPase subunit alpha